MMEVTEVNLSTAREWLTWLREQRVLSTATGDAAIAELDAAVDCLRSGREDAK
jgi:hypothetical protein